MKNEHKKNLDRRDFLKVLGGAAAVTSATLLPGCKNKQESAYTATTDIPTDQMTYRINPSTQDRVSLLGYGCMRWPTVSNNSARDSSDDIDQETVNKLVDVAIAHGVNYFDTSPAYCKGRSERATGIALSRYPRDKYFIATKLSNLDLIDVKVEDLVFGEVAFHVDGQPGFLGLALEGLVRSGRRKDRQLD